MCVFCSSLKNVFLQKRNLNNKGQIVDSTGNTVVKYVYDAWGNFKILDASGVEITDDTHIGVLNPFRYRSYYYDTETDLYFLKTRYYDPEIGRFITIDDISYLDPETINGLNLYAYCGNNPVNRVDYTGTFAITTAIIIGLIAGAVIGGIIGGVVAYNQASADGATGWSLVGQTALGVLGGAIIGAAIGGLIGAAAPYIGGFLSASFPILAPTMVNGTIGWSAVATVTGAEVVGGAIAGAAVLMFYNGKWPGDDPTKAPDGFEWRGNGLAGSSQGNWYNPSTGEILHPDLNHPEPIGPHWDFRDVLRNWWRIFKNGKFPK